MQAPALLSLGAPSSLGTQLFGTSTLDRAQDTKAQFDGSVSCLEVALLPVAGRDVAFRQQSHQGHDAPGVLLPPGAASHDLQMLLLAANDPQLDLNSDFICLQWYQDEQQQEPHRLPLYLLGKDASQRWTFALDISGPLKDAFLDFLSTSCGLTGVQTADLRSLMACLSPEACAIAGQAAALSQWHLTSRYCSRCGAPTLPTEAGMRRRCPADHKTYPRTDPVVIMLVESPDGQRALLGRSAKFTPGMYTCLSGFIDQCESIEEAVRREVREEARVAVSEVQIVGTQPWPIGRYGSSELMLGCVAKARSYEILVNPSEMEDVQWFERAELRAAVELYQTAGDSTLADLQQASLEKLGFFVPPPFAIAHHLIRIWAECKQPWFASTATASMRREAADVGEVAPHGTPNRVQDIDAEAEELAGRARMP
ncbi:NUDIX hydrolase domain-like protein [Haematococcus lacustris]